METSELKNIWKAHDNILDKSMKLNMLCIETIQSQKSKSKLKPLLILRIIESIVLIKIILFLFGFLYDYLSDIPVAISSVILIIYSVYALFLCSAQIIIIAQINYSDSVTEIQKKLSLLQIHILDYFRLTFLMIPFWLIYPIIGFKLIAEVDIINEMPYWWLISQIIILMPLSLYAFKQVSYKNIHKRWVRFLINNAGGKSVTKAMEFLKVLDEFKRD